MPISFSALEVGKKYTRPELAKLWSLVGYEAIARGIVTPLNTNLVILFITEEKRIYQTQYDNILEGTTLRIEGEKGHQHDKRLIEAESNGDKIHLFYRKIHRSGFAYKGQIYLSDYQQYIDRPSRFRFSLDRLEAEALSDIETDLATNGESNKEFQSDPEGRRRIRRQVYYERSPQNRAEALRIHKPICGACGFDFNIFYGKTWARSFIQVHHVRSVTQQAGRKIDPQTDLRPLCSNCHSMAHRQRDRILTLEELKQLIRDARK